MKKVLFVLFVFFKTLNSQTIIDNTTIPSDFLRNAFFDEILTNTELSRLDFGDINNAGKCILQLKELANFSQNSLLFFDPWGKFPSGILSGHFTDLGNYDQCVETSAVIIPEHGITHGQYCFATLPSLLSSSFSSAKNSSSSAEVNEAFEKDGLASMIVVKLGICIPDLCSQTVVNKILDKVAANALNGRLKGSTISHCSVAKKTDIRSGDIIAIVFFAFIGLLMVFSTFYDIATTNLGKKPMPILLAFSVISNGRKLFMINTDKSPNSITCLNGIRLFSILWVLYCHNYGAFALINIVNKTYILKWTRSIWTMPILMGTVSVDSFFLLSGLLIAWMGLKELDKRNGKLNIPLMYFHRYIRLTPALAAIVIYYIAINSYIGSGPYREPSSPCGEYWWQTLLYIQNYTGSPLCVAQAWYLACDFQLFILSPFILIPLWRWGKKCFPAIAIFIALSIGCVVATFYANGYNSVSGLGDIIQGPGIPSTYIKTHGRYPAWLVGITLGYLMHVNRNRTFRPHWIIQLIGWVLSLGTMFFIIFGLHFLLDYPYQSSIGVAAANETLKRLCWAIALAWIIFACHFGFGGVVNSILSHPFWQPMARLQYCMYLVHMAVQEVNYSTSRTDAYFSDYRMFLEFWSTFGVTVVVSIALSLSFEAPVLVVEKVLLGEKKSKSNSCDDLLPPTFQNKEV